MKLAFNYIGLFFLANFILSCSSPAANNVAVQKQEIAGLNTEHVFETQDTLLQKGDGLLFSMDIPVSGRYRVEVRVKTVAAAVTVWLEDYIHNTDDRTYNVTGDLTFDAQKLSAAKDGSPFKEGKHDMRLNVSEGSVEIEAVKFTLLKEHTPTPTQYQQNMSGKKWRLVWSDEFEGTGLPDTAKWDYNRGNWGWGNNELQYYTEHQQKNARLADGNLIIEAHKNKASGEWTSARLTTQGKASFLYGKIEFRAKVPTGRGTWAAGWFLGDDYVDELSWPYCGEIDVLECVGFEINDTTGNGINHATCHTRSYYFKQGNQIGSDIVVENMNKDFHTYAIEWYPYEIKAFVDGKHYYTYDKNADELEWPFNKSQNIVINLAIGGGWGGAKGMDSNLISPQYILDYVRVYETTNTDAE
ncbi:MAG: beta-glucanase (GH16 family) [Salibacteraceae bacterium]|jgi:beta-glucanase (GH16 family)